MNDFCLVPHPESAAPGSRRVSVAMTQHRGSEPLCPTTLHLLYVVEGPTTSLVIPAPAAAERADELWRTTCLELFVQVGARDYLEFNFAPSSRWAAYRFSAYRAGMEPLLLHRSPTIAAETAVNSLTVTVSLELPRGVSLAAIGLAAVVQELNGSKSYWALVHPEGPPDFHNPDCFTARLPPPDNV